MSSCKGVNSCRNFRDFSPTFSGKTDLEIYAGEKLRVVQGLDAYNIDSSPWDVSSGCAWCGFLEVEFWVIQRGVVTHAATGREVYQLVLWGSSRLKELYSIPSTVYLNPNKCLILSDPEKGTADERTHGLGLRKSCLRNKMHIPAIFG